MFLNFGRILGFRVLYGRLMFRILHDAGLYTVSGKRSDVASCVLGFVGSGRFAGLYRIVSEIVSLLNPKPQTLSPKLQTLNPKP